MVQGSKRLACLASAVPVPLWRRILRMGPATAAILSTLSPAIPVQSLRLCTDASIPTAMLAAEERQVIRSYKIGVLYAKAGQRTEAELFGNRHGEGRSRAAARTVRPAPTPFASVFSF